VRLGSLLRHAASKLCTSHAVPQALEASGALTVLRAAQLRADSVEERRVIEYNIMLARAMLNGQLGGRAACKDRFTVFSRRVRSSRSCTASSSPLAYGPWRSAAPPLFRRCLACVRR
jgi:hypothetical protein